MIRADSAGRNIRAIIEGDVRFQEPVAVYVERTVPNLNFLPRQSQDTLYPQLLSGPNRNDVSPLRRPRTVGQLVDQSDLAAVQGWQHALGRLSGETSFRFGPERSCG